MSTIVIHGIPGSPYVRMPLLACEEKGVPYRLAAMEFGKTKTPEHLAHQPFGRIPYMEHDGFWLYEAQAIIRYIDRAFEGPSLTPTDPKALARMDQVIGIIDWYVMPSISSGIGFNRIVKPIFGMPVDEAVVAAAVPQAQVCVAALEDILADKPYFAGDRVSLADLMAVSHLDLLPQSPEGADIMAGSPLLAWLDRMAERPSVQKTTMHKMMNLPESAAA
ncbi:glutathione S-transferase family protein [Phenylobacterium sp.]|jgi:glutathione S-transferase|uniref:glutathione S-transferase family protein n=1 Tax=Phenylobacterium sp. TaxID=1871053 RepID=UPI002E31734F|nr:glutathione S-transferase family protein [Phenylobacterium sp.]HEX4712712.1 glutathione S-transferase family protein [Phenylobacterium sp.]